MQVYYVLEIVRAFQLAQNCVLLQWMEQNVQLEQNLLHFSARLPLSVSGACQNVKFKNKVYRVIKFKPHQKISLEFHHALTTENGRLISSWLLLQHGLTSQWVRFSTKARVIQVVWTRMRNFERWEFVGLREAVSALGSVTSITLARSINNPLIWSGQRE